MTNDEVIAIRAGLNKAGLDQWAAAGLNLVQQAMFSEQIGIAPAEQGLLIRTSDSLSAIARLVGNPATTQADLDAEIALAMNRLTLISAVKKSKAASANSAT